MIEPNGQRLEVSLGDKYLLTLSRSNHSVEGHRSGLDILLHKRIKRIKVEVWVGGEVAHALSFSGKNLNPFVWKGEQPVDVPLDETITLHVKDVKAIWVMEKSLGSCTFSIDDWPQHEPEREMTLVSSKFTATLRLATERRSESRRELIHRASESAAKHQSILSLLGTARIAVEVIVALLEHVADAHPIAQVALGTLTKAFAHLEQEEKYDNSLRSLAAAMTNMLSFTEMVSERTKIVALKNITTQMLLLVEEVSRFIIDYKSKSAIGRAAVSLINSEKRDAIEDYVKKFNALRSAFDTGVIVQVLKTSDQVALAIQAAEQMALGERERSLLDRLPRAFSARYDPTRACMDGTRVGILEDIFAWTEDASSPHSILWVNGLAGTGKSSIAASVALNLDKTQQLGASFFCRRDKPELRDPALLLPTIAGRLALCYPAYGKALSEEIRLDPDVGHAAIPLQFDGLFVLPVRRLEASASLPPAEPVVVVIDAFDECGDGQARRVLLDCLVKLFRLCKWIRIFITSRPDADIDRALNKLPSCLHIPLPLDAEATFEDILLFTRVRMAQLAEAQDLDTADWPGEDRMKEFALRAGGLFIWAQTASTFIFNGQDPDSRLHLVLSGESPVGAYSKLDSLYTTALVDTFGEYDDDNIRVFREVVGTVIAIQSPLCVESLATFLQKGISAIALRNIVRNMAALLFEDQKNDMIIRVCHLSFIDYLTDVNRCPPRFFIDLNQHHAHLAALTLTCMLAELRFNICEIPSSNFSNSEILDLQIRIQEHISSSLRYSCLHWMTHCSHIQQDTSELDEVVGYLDELLSQPTILYWIEVLSLIGEIDAALVGLPHMVSRLQQWKHPESPFLADIRRFIVAFREPIGRSTPHLYLSALPFAPMNSLVSKRFLPTFPNLVALGDRDMYWSSCVYTLEGHSDHVVSVTISADGHRVFTASRDHSIRVWNVDNGSPATEPFRGHSGPVTSIALSADGQYLASASQDQTVRIWDVDTGECVKGPLDGHHAAVYCVSWSPDMSHIVSGSADKRVRCWELETGQLTWESQGQGHGDWVRAVTYSPDGSIVVSGSADRTMRVWDALKGTPLRRLTHHLGIVFSINFSPDGMKVVSGSSDRVIHVWDSATDELIIENLKGHKGGLRSTQFSPDGHQIISASSDCTVRVWDAVSGQQIREFRGHTGPVYAACFTPDGRRLISGSSDNTARIWDLESGDMTSLASETVEPIISLTASPDGKYIAAGSKGGQVYLWRTNSGISISESIITHNGNVTAVAFSPDGRLLLTGSSDKQLKIWNARTGALLHGPFVGHSRPITCAIFSTDGRYIISGSDDRSVRKWDIETGEQVGEPWRGHWNGITSISTSPDGRHIGSCSRDGTVRTWDGARFTILSPRLKETFPWSVAFSPNGDRIASFADDESIYLWRADTKEQVWRNEPSGMRGRVCGIFSADGCHIFFGGYSAIQVLDAETGATVAQHFYGHFSAISSLAVSLDGRRLFSGSLDGTVRVWDVEKLGSDDEDEREIQRSATRLINQVGTDGWIQRRNEDDPMLWIPVEYRHGLWKRAVRVLPATAMNHPRELDCSKFCHGASWVHIRGY